MLGNLEQKRLMDYLIELKSTVKDDRDMNQDAHYDNTIFSFNTMLNKSIENIIKTLSKEPSKEALVNQIKEDLEMYSEIDIDTEDRENICQYYYDIASIGGVSISKELNIFLYGALGEFL